MPEDMKKKILKRIQDSSSTDVEKWEERRDGVRGSLLVVVRDVKSVVTLYTAGFSSSSVGAFWGV